MHRYDISLYPLGLCVAKLYPSAERANEDIYDDLKLKKKFGPYGLYKHISALKWNNYLFYIIVSRLYNAAFNVIMYNNEK